MQPDSPVPFDEADVPEPVRFLSRDDLASALPGASKRPHEAPILSADLPFAMGSDALEVERPEAEHEGVPVPLPNLLDLSSPPAQAPLASDSVSDGPSHSQLRAELNRAGILRAYAFVAGLAIGAACASALLLG